LGLLLQDANLQLQLLSGAEPVFEKDSDYAPSDRCGVDVLQTFYQTVP